MGISGLGNAIFSKEGRVQLRNISLKCFLAYCHTNKQFWQRSVCFQIILEYLAELLLKPLTKKYIQLLHTHIFCCQNEHKHSQPQIFFLQAFQFFEPDK